MKSALKKNPKMSYIMSSTTQATCRSFTLKYIRKHYMYFLYIYNQFTMSDVSHLASDCSIRHYE